MYIQQLAVLTEYLANGKRTLDDACKYLVLHTLKEFSAQAIYVGGVESDGHLTLRSSFGFEANYINQWERIPLSVEIPVVEAIKNNSVMIFSDQNKFFDSYPRVNEQGTMDRNWSSCIASPIQNIGAYFLVLDKKIKVTVELEYYLESIGNLLAIILQESENNHELKVTTPKRVALTKSSLSPRQELIRNLLAKGFTNPQIASEIGFSESLVRQETISIYAHMNVSGRKELIKKMEENLQADGLHF
ncbi:MAG: LuxR C-terminal-related transcriptional regulator [Candidatus Planktophila sp.]